LKEFLQIVKPFLRVTIQAANQHINWSPSWSMGLGFSRNFIYLSSNFLVSWSLWNLLHFYADSAEFVHSELRMFGRYTRTNKRFRFCPYSKIFIQQPGCILFGWKRKPAYGFQRQSLDGLKYNIHCKTFIRS